MKIQSLFLVCFCMLLSMQTAHAKDKLSDPDFLIIGCMKSGTTQLTYFLSQHPNIGCHYKEMHFFDTNFEKGRKWYQKQLPRKKNHILVTGEDTPSYICNEKVPSRVFSMYPHIKMIVILRNPTDRTYSHHQMRVRYNKETLSFEDALELERQMDKRPIEGRTPPLYPYIATSEYVNHFEKWFSYFARNQFLILFSEDLKKDPLNTLNKVCAFLGVPPFHKMPKQDKELVKSYPPMNEATRNDLDNYFAPFNADLARLLGRELPWRAH